MIKNIMTTEDFKGFSELFFFENRLHDELADYIAISGKYLFRRDEARLISYEMEEDDGITYHYPIETLEKEGYGEVQLKDRQNLSFNKGDEETVLTPIDVPYLTGTLQLLSSVDFNFEVQLDTKSIVRSLLAIQRKVLNQDIELDQVVLAFNFFEKKVSVDLPEGRFETLVKGEFGQLAKENIVYYSYPLFKDFFQNANSLNKEIKLSIKTPYYTVIQYTEKIKGLLTHKIVSNETA